MSRQNFIALSFAGMAFFFGAYIFIFLPHDRYVESLSIFLFKLIPFLFAALSISLVDVDGLGVGAARPVIITFAFLVFFCFYIPRMFFSLLNNDANDVYYMTLVIVPFMILTLALSYRLGGGHSGATLRLSFALLAVMLSGIEDLAFFVVNDHPIGRFNPIPETWEWVSHLAVRIGHPPTKYEVYASIILHFALAGLILFTPLRLPRRLQVFLGLAARAAS